MKKNICKILLLSVCLLTLSACGGAQSFTSAEDGLIITADSSWQMPDKEDGLQAAYGESESEVAEMVECILEQNGGKALLSVEKNDVSAYLSEQANYITWLNRQYNLLPEDELDNWLSAQNQDDTALLDAYREAAIADDTSAETLNYIEILNEDANWLSQLSTVEGYELLGKEEADILGQKTQILHYKYAANEDTMLEFMEVSAIKDNMLYTVTIWAEESQFAKNQATYKAMLTSLAWVGASEAETAE